MMPRDRFSIVLQNHTTMGSLSCSCVYDYPALTVKPAAATIRLVEPLKPGPPWPRGTKVILECGEREGFEKANPPANYIWIRGGSTAPLTVTRRLTILHGQPEESVSYFCTAFNSVGAGATSEGVTIEFQNPTTTPAQTPTPRPTPLQGEWRKCWEGGQIVGLNHVIVMHL